MSKVPVIAPDGTITTVVAQKQPARLYVPPENLPWPEWDWFPGFNNPKPRQIDKLLKDFATSTKTLAKLCKKHKITLPMFFSVARKHPVVLYAFEDAQAVKAHVLMDECIDIADNARNDRIDGPKGIKVANPTAVKRAELRIKTRQTLAERTNTRYRATSEIDIKSRSINVDIPIDQEKLKEMNPSDLFAAVQRIGRGGV